jgi:hypothetical protein
MKIFSFQKRKNLEKRVLKTFYFHIPFGWIQEFNHCGYYQQKYLYNHPVVTDSYLSYLIFLSLSLQLYNFCTTSWVGPAAEPHSPAEAACSLSRYLWSKSAPLNWDTQQQVSEFQFQSTICETLTEGDGSIPLTSLY